MAGEILNYGVEEKSESKIFASPLSLSASLASLLDFAGKNKKMKSGHHPASQVCFLIAPFLLVKEGLFSVSDNSSAFIKVNKVNRQIEKELELIWKDRIEN